MSRTQVNQLVRQLHEAQQRATEQVLANASFETLDHVTPDGFTVKDTLRMWQHELWSHHRDLVLARGRLVNDNPHFHVPHFVREANEAFGRFVGELACLTDEQLDMCVPDGGRSIREVATHVLGTLTGYVPDQVRRATEDEPPAEPPST